MNREDWLDYFETINGRKPSPAEFKAALDRGEFVFERKSDVQTQATQAIKTPAQPAQTYRSSQIPTQAAVINPEKQAQPFSENSKAQLQANKEVQKLQKAAEKTQAQELKRKAKEEKARLKTERRAESAQAKTQHYAEKNTVNTEQAVTPVQAQNRVKEPFSQPLKGQTQLKSDAEQVRVEPLTASEQQSFQPVSPAVKQVFRPAAAEQAVLDSNRQEQNTPLQKAGENTAIPVFSNRPSTSAAGQTVSQVQEQVNEQQYQGVNLSQTKQSKVKAEKAAAKKQAKQAKRARKAALQVEKTNNPNRKSRKGLFISLIAAIILLIGASTAGGYSWWRYASGSIEGTWQLVSYQRLDEDSGKMTDVLASYKENNQVYTALLAVKDKKVSHYSYFYEKGSAGDPSLSVNNYLGSYQEIDQWNKSFIYTQSSSEMEAKLTESVEAIYPHAEQDVIDSYIKDNMNRYKKYKEGKSKKTYEVDGDKLTVSSYNSDGDLLEKEVYKKLSSSNAKQAKSDYDDAKSAFEKNNGIKLKD